MAECHLTHGHARHGDTSPTYVSWVSMRRRVRERRENYEHVLVDPSWDSYEQFLADMGERPDGTTLDRIDPAGNYTRTNCRWATPKEQVNNLRTNVVLSIAGLALTVTEWSELVGIDRQAIYARLKRGWAAADAVLRPLRQQPRDLT